MVRSMWTPPWPPGSGGPAWTIVAGQPQLRRDLRYRDDQPLPVGTRVLLLPGGTGSDYRYMCAHNGGGNPAHAIVLPIGGFTFNNCVNVQLIRRGPMLRGEDLVGETIQWHEDYLIPVDELAPIDEGPEQLERWLDT